MPKASAGRLIALLTVLCLVSGCSLLVPPSREPASPARWELDPADPPAPADTSFVALVTEIGCSSGRPIDDKLLPPIVDYGEDEIVVRLYLKPLSGGRCLGIAPTRFVIPLSEPIGDRTLVDGSGSAGPAVP